MGKTSKMLRQVIEKEGYSLRGMARAIGIDHASLCRSLKDDGNPESRTIEKILDYLGYDLKFIKGKEVRQKERPSLLRKGKNLNKKGR